eukprot:6186142-Pleurochrysis_carterae.AAC.8
MSNSDRIDNTSRAPHADAYSRSQVPPFSRDQACIMSSICASSAKSARTKGREGGLQGIAPWQSNASTLPGSEQKNSSFRCPSLEAPPMMYNAGVHNSYGMSPFSQKPSTCWAELFGGGAFRRVLPGLTRGEPLPPPKRRRAACPGCNWQSIAIGSCSLLCTDCLNLIQPPDSNQPPHGALRGS